MDYIEYIMTLTEAELRASLISSVERLRDAAILSKRITDKHGDDEDADNLWQLLRRAHPTEI